MLLFQGSIKIREKYFVRLRQILIAQRLKIICTRIIWKAILYIFFTFIGHWMSVLIATYFPDRILLSAESRLLIWHQRRNAEQETVAAQGIALEQWLRKV